MSEEFKPGAAKPAERDRKGQGGSTAKPTAAKTASANPKSPAADSNTLKLIAAAVVSLLVGILLGALLFGGDDDDAVVSASAPTGAQVVTPEDLAAEAQSLGRPVYWAGPQAGSEIELERTAEGNTSIRYIPEGEEGGGETGDYLTVVTYPYPDAHGALTQQAAAGDVLSRELPNGGFAISQPDQPTNAYLAYKGEDYQVEIYDPRPGRALKLIIDGSIVPAG